ncbi:MAG: hypothetical protein IT285_15920 [Bdellovibrionales bacterium]|nr:hypothetical protein [Bdellovibrionales bacterium]
MGLSGVGGAALLSLVAVVGMGGCGENPLSTGAVTLKSSAFAGGGPARLDVALAEPGSLPSSPFDLAATAITDLSFCITQLKIEAPDGVSIEDDDGDELMEVTLGQVSAGDGTVPMTWGAADLPVGAEIEKIKVEVHHDPEKCGGAEYSVSLNGNALTKDVEMVFKFTPARTLAEGDTVVFDLGTLANAFVSALDAGQYTDELIGDYIEDIEEAAETEDD